MVIAWKIWFLRPYMMSFVFMHVIFAEKKFEIDTQVPKIYLVIHLHVRKYLKPPKTYHLRFSTFLASFYVIFVFKIALKGEFWLSGSLWSTRVHCMCLIWPNAFWGLVSIYLKSLPPNIMFRNGNFIMTGRKKHFFSHNLLME